MSESGPQRGFIPGAGIPGVSDPPIFPDAADGLVGSQSRNPPSEAPGLLILADGTRYNGVLFGAETIAQGELVFTEKDLNARYADLAPEGQVDLVVIGCPQASLEEIRITAAAVRSHAEMGAKIPDQRLWVFTSGENYQLALADGSVEMLEQAGAVLLQDTCPEVTPYNRTHYNHLLTNSLKAEHYLTSGLNRLPTSVMPIVDCVSHAFDPTLSEGPRPILSAKAQPQHASAKSHQVSDALLTGAPLQSQDDFSITGPAMVTDVPITYLGYVNRDTGVIEETGHPLDGRAIENSILIYPKGSGSTVAPFVLMGLLYTERAQKPLSIVMFVRSLYQHAPCWVSLMVMDLTKTHAWRLTMVTLLNSNLKTALFLLRFLNESNEVIRCRV